LVFRVASACFSAPQPLVGYIDPKGLKYNDFFVSHDLPPAGS